MTSRPDYSDRGLVCDLCVWWKIRTSSLFDADLFESWREPVVGHPMEYIPVASVKLVPGAVELNYSSELLRYGVECDKGQFSAQQIVYGDAGDAVEVGLWIQELTD